VRLRVGGCLGVELAGQQRNLRPALVSGLLQDRRNFGIGDEVLKSLFVPVEHRVIREQAFRNKEEALEAVGLSEEASETG
jgi:hypothetical protein